MKPKKGYKAKLDYDTNTQHYIPKDGRSHRWDKCWCHPIIDISGSVHHHFSKLNNARCEK